jgi:hypothetical protein
MPIYRFHRFILAICFAVQPASAFPWGSQAGDNGRQPIGADNDSPRQAIPNATTNDATVDYGIAYYGATSVYERALYYCDQKPVEVRDACRDGAEARYGYPEYGYRDEQTGQYPAYLTYVPGNPDALAYGQPGAPGSIAYYDPRTADYYAYPRYPGDTSTRNTNTSPRCAALSGAARVDCLHGSAAGG